MSVTAKSWASTPYIYGSNAYVTTCATKEASPAIYGEPTKIRRDTIPSWDADFNDCLHFTTQGHMSGELGRIIALLTIWHRSTMTTFFNKNTS